MPSHNALPTKAPDWPSSAPALSLLIQSLKSEVRKYADHMRRLEREVERICLEERERFYPKHDPQNGIVVVFHGAKPKEVLA